MSDLNNIVNHPAYEEAATAQSKAGIFLFFLTYLYMQFGTDMSSGFIGGILFLGIGMFVVSLGIMMPAMMVRLKMPYPIFGSVMAIIEIAVVIFATRWAFVGLFG